VTNGEGGDKMKKWILRKLFFSNMFKYIRKGYYLEAYNQGKLDQLYEELHIKEGK
jgi:hypothetical protein